MKQSATVPGTLFFLCGKMGAGKSTLAASLVQEHGAVLLSEDAWLAALYPEQITSLEDYVVLSRRLRQPVAVLVRSMLIAGTDVVMDFAANTVQQRAWFKTLLVDTGAPHELIHVDTPDDVCLERIAQRRLEQPDRAATDTEAMFRAVTAHFSAPESAEGFNLVTLHNGTD